ncbi:MAG: transglutaminase family protein, partial [Flavobacterium sp.]
QRQKLLKGRGELSESTIGKISALVSGINDPKEKARAIYEYMQSKTRYISVQIGIGGWQPTFASEVDELGYGDCKGLTNYTQALLKSQGIESYYTIVDSGPGGQDIDEDFVALQGDHVILTVPFDDENVFLECTSQQLPFNFLGTHTDDRKVLMVTPEGGMMTRTHTYSPEDNKIELKANVTLQESLKLSGTLTQTSSGIQYANRYYMEDETSDDVNNRYKQYWSHLNNLDLADINFSNDKKEVKFTESLWFETEGYVSMAGSRILLNPNIFQRIEDIPSKVNNRTQPLVIRRGFTETDNITLLLPLNYELESVFDPVSITTKFGTYRSSVEIVNEATIRYKREFLLNSGRYPKEDFNAYVDFIKDVVRSDRSKIVFIQK